MLGQNLTALQRVLEGLWGNAHLRPQGLALQRSAFLLWQEVMLPRKALRPRQGSVQYQMTLLLWQKYGRILRCRRLPGDFLALRRRRGSWVRQVYSLREERFTAGAGDTCTFLVFWLLSLSSTDDVWLNDPFTRLGWR